MEFEQFLKIWNNKGKGWLKTHRLVKPLLNNKLLMMRFKESEIDSAITECAIEEVKWFMQNDDFWAKRRGKQGVPWFFQYRGGKQDGEPNWVWFYEHRVNRLELEEDKKEEYQNVFKFEKTGELP
jgi:DNA modification methylase